MPASEVSKSNGANGKKPPTVAGIFEIRCRVCRLQKSHKALADLIHKWRFQDNMTYRDVAAAFLAEIEVRGLDVKPINISTFTVHFNQHVPADAAYINSTQRARRPMQDEAVVNQALEYKKENLDKLQKNFERWQAVLAALFKRAERLLKIEEEGPVVNNEGKEVKLLNSDDVNAMKGATDAMAKLTATMDRYVKDREFILNVMETGINHYATQMSARSGMAMARLREEALERVDDHEAIDWIFVEVQARLSGAADNLYVESQDATIERFNI